MHRQHDDIEELFWGEKEKRKPARKRKKADYEGADWATMMFIMVLFALSALSGLSAARIYYAQPSIGMDLSEAPPANAQEVKKDNIVSILILGTDEREGEKQARSDTIMLAFLDSQTKQINILSLPRDTYIKIPGVSKKTKLNHAHAIGGTKLTAETLQDFLGVNIDYYLETNFDGFAQAIDAIDGVDIVVEKQMYYPEEGIDLQAGLQHLDGEKALQYVRYRSDGLGDIGRIERQQKFLQAVAEKLLSPKTIVKLPAIAKAVTSAVKTDLDYSTMLTLVAAVQKLNGESIKTHTLPGEAKYMGGISYWVADEVKLKEVLTAANVEFVPESERNSKWK